MYMPINPLGYSCIKKLQRDNLWHAYNEPINFYSVALYINVWKSVEHCKLEKSPPCKAAGTIAEKESTV